MMRSPGMVVSASQNKWCGAYPVRGIAESSDGTQGPSNTAEILLPSVSRSFCRFPEDGSWIAVRLVECTDAPMNLNQARTMELDTWLDGSQRALQSQPVGRLAVLRMRRTDRLGSCNYAEVHPESLRQMFKPGGDRGHERSQAEVLRREIAIGRPFDQNDLKWVVWRPAHLADLPLQLWRTRERAVLELALVAFMLVSATLALIGDELSGVPRPLSIATLVCTFLIVFLTTRRSVRDAVS